jgi:Leucine-rich repeat (LRR) protein
MSGVIVGCTFLQEKQKYTAMVNRNQMQILELQNVSFPHRLNYINVELTELSDNKKLHDGIICNYM